MAQYDITTAAASLEFDTTNLGSPAGVKGVDDNHFIVFYGGEANDGYSEVFTINTTTWAVTTSAARLEFDTQYGAYDECQKIDTNHFVNFWQGSSDTDGYAQAFTVNTTTWAVTTSSATILEFDTVYCGDKSSFIIPDYSNYVILFWQGNGALGYAQVFTVNTTTWEVTTAASSLTFATQNNDSNSCYCIDSTHFINFWHGNAAVGLAQVFTVNTTTWAVTTAATPLSFAAAGNSNNTCYQVDANHFINFSQGESSDGYAQVFTVNTTTWAVTTSADALEFDTQSYSWGSCCAYDSNHFILNWYGGFPTLGYTQVFTVNTSTFVVTTAAASLNFDTTIGTFNRNIYIGTNRFLNIWQGAGNDGFVQTFSVATAASGPANVKTYLGLAAASVKTVDGLAIASVKTFNGLA